MTASGGDLAADALRRVAGGLLANPSGFVAACGSTERKDLFAGRVRISERRGRPNRRELIWDTTVRGSIPPLQCGLDISDLLDEQETVRDPSEPEGLVEVRDLFVECVYDHKSRCHGLGGIDDARERVGNQNFAEAPATQ